MATQKIYRTLHQLERKHICNIIEVFIPLAQNTSSPMRAIARDYISFTLWRWTADAVLCAQEREQPDIVKRDQFKYNCDIHPSTKAARDVRHKGVDGLRHEHVIPRDFIVNGILTMNLQGEKLYNFLLTFCKAAIVTKEEDGLLKPKKTMPSGWNWDSQDIYARYKVSNIQLYASDGSRII
jgi:hypothetical protein